GARGGGAGGEAAVAGRGADGEGQGGDGCQGGQAARRYTSAARLRLHAGPPLHMAAAVSGCTLAITLRRGGRGRPSAGPVVCFSRSGGAEGAVRGRAGGLAQRCEPGHRKRCPGWEITGERFPV